jgi:hypothetical protein
MELTQKTPIKLLRKGQVLVVHAVILGIWKAKTGRIMVQGQPGQAV